MTAPIQPGNQTRRTQIKWLGVAALIVVIALAIARPWEESESQHGIIDRSSPNDVQVGLVVGDLPPDFVLLSTDGGETRLSDHQGTPVMLNFWATWCTFCVAEMPAMQELSNQYRNQMIVIGVNSGESVDTATVFADRAGVRYRLLLDSNQDVTRAYKVNTMPTTYLISADGTIAHVRFGVMTDSEMDELVQAYLLPGSAGQFQPSHRGDE